MANTFDTSRVGGGTYELAQDANGNYNLNSVGFTQVNKLNLPDLKTSDVAATTKKATEDTVKAQTTEVFKPTNTYSGGSDQGNNNQSMVASPRTVLNSENSKISVREAGSTPANEFATQQAKANQAAPQENIGTTPTYQDGILRGQTGVKYSKPPSLTSKATSAVQDTVSGAADSVKNSKAIQFASTALGFMTNPVMGGLKMISKALPKDSPADKFNRGYFNMDDASEGGRISGNPATDLYAGMNAVSAFGNIEKAGQKRISTREKTSAKLVGVKKEKFDTATQVMRDQQSTYQKNKDNTVPDKGYTRTATERKANPGRQDANTMSGGSDSAGSSRVICTELHRTKELSTRDWVMDIQFTYKKLSAQHVKGYLVWAIPTVQHIIKYPKYRKVWNILHNIEQMILHGE